MVTRQAKPMWAWMTLLFCVGWCGTAAAQDGLTLPYSEDMKAAKPLFDITNYDDNALPNPEQLAAAWTGEGNLVTPGQIEKEKCAVVGRYGFYMKPPLGGGMETLNVGVLGGVDYGVAGVSKGKDTYGVVAQSVEGTGLYAKGGPEGLAAWFDGSVLIRGKVRIASQTTGQTLLELGDGLDYAEGFDVSDNSDVGPGSVLVIDPAHPGNLRLSTTAYDTKVAGIVAGAKGLGSGVRLGTGQFDKDVALAGRVYCNVDATSTGVRPGDLLTTSTTPGYAVKVVDHVRAQGAILGKAMESLEQGKKGQILVLVTLQ
jgi:hypothetical protein